MKVRLGLVLATAALMSGAGCATGGAGGGASAPAAVPSAVSGQGQVLPEGVRPRDNNHTRSADLYLTQAQTAAEDADKMARFRDALGAANEGITADPQNPKSYFQAAQAMVGLNDFIGADSMFFKAEELHPRYVLETEPWRENGWVNAYNAAIVPMNNGDLEEAVAIFEQANSLYDKRPEAYLQLGSLYSRLNDPAGSAGAFRTAMELLEDTKETQMLDTLAAPVWEQHWEIATMGLGTALTFSEEFEEAAELYGGMLTEDPENTQILGSLAGVLTELGMADSVQVLYDNLLNRPGLTERDYFNAGVGLYQIEQYEAAADAFRRAAEMNPFNRDARLNLTQTYYAASEWEALIPAANDLLEMDPLNGTVRIFLARAHSELEQAEEAGAVFQEYTAIGYEIESMRLDGRLDGGATITGIVKLVQDSAAEPGTTVTLRFHFGGDAGEEVGTQTYTFQLPAEGEVVEFGGDFASSQLITGYRYEVVG